MKRTGDGSLFLFPGPPLETSWGGMRIKRFCHSSEIFQDENSLSLEGNEGQVLKYNK